MDGVVTTGVSAPPKSNMKARLELEALLEDALARADNLGEPLTALRISQALDTLRQHL